MLSELRKYRVNLTLAHQYLSQLDEDVRDAILGNAAAIISFRLGVTDPEILTKEFYPEFSVEDLINLPNYNIYLKLMIDGRVSKPFSEETSGLIEKGRPGCDQFYRIVSQFFPDAHVDA